MSPLFPANDLARSFFRNSIAFGEININASVVFKIGSHFLYLFFGQLRMNFSFVIRAATFLPHIFHIIFCGTNKQMKWIYASPVVTLVTDLHSTRNSSIVKSPGHPMCTNANSRFGRKLAIPSRRFSPDPFPAVMKWNHFNFRPKSFCSRASFSHFGEVA